MAFIPSPAEPGYALPLQTGRIRKIDLKSYFFTINVVVLSMQRTTTELPKLLCPCISICEYVITLSTLGKKIQQTIF